MILKPHNFASFSLSRLVLFLLIFGGLSISAAAQTAAPIAEDKITTLRQELAQGMEVTSAVDLRRACKGVIRKAEAVLTASPDASNRYGILAIVFQAQKRLLSLESTKPNREAIFETCRKLQKAPDEYAELRFEADMLLSEKKMAENNATVDERVQALQALMARYRGTPAERRSLMIGSTIAPKLLAFDLEEKILARMSERFGGNHEAIIFRRKRANGGKVDAVFSGTYARADGSKITFPNDRLGHNVLFFFWSQTTSKMDEYIGALKDMQSMHPGMLEVYSFNLDERPDAGQKLLRDLGVDWPALHLPGGRNSTTYRAYAQTDPCAVLANAQGHVFLVGTPESLKTAASSKDRLRRWNASIRAAENRLDNERYLAQLRYLFNGDFLVGHSESPESIPPATFQAIQACFVAPPFRYRLTEQESLSNYTKAEELCTAVIEKHPQAPGLWVVRNHRIIARLGMWNLAREPKHLEAAVKEAQTMLAMELPPEAEIVPRFCLTRNTLRNGDADPAELLKEFVEKTGGADAPSSALAAAAILALEANASTPYASYRQQLLNHESDSDPQLWPVYAFLRDKHHRYRNFHASPGGYGYDRPAKYKFRNMVSGLLDPRDTSRKLEAEFTMLNGQHLRIPQDTSGEMLGILFAEPPGDEAASKNLMKKVNSFAKEYATRGVDVVVVFITEDKNTVRSLVEESEVEFTVAILPKGLKNPLVQKLGILSADRIPNPFLLRPDGTIAWSISGLRYKAFRDTPDYAIGIAIEHNIAKVRSDIPFEALEKREFKKALQLFAKALPPNKEKDWWTAARLHGRALAYMGLEDWEAALAEINAAIQQRHTDVRSGLCKCHGVVEMLLTKAAILEKLGRSREAAAQRRLAEDENNPHALVPPGIARQGVPLGVYYDWLKRIRRHSLQAKGNNK